MNIIWVIANIYFILLLFHFYISLLLPLFSFFISFYLFFFLSIFLVYIFLFFPLWSTVTLICNFSPSGYPGRFLTPALAQSSAKPSHSLGKYLILPPFTYTFLQGITNSSWPGEEFANIHSLFVIGVLKKTFHVTLSTD